MLSRSADHFRGHREVQLDVGPRGKAYFWHRFFSHQPDLNYDNPAVQQAILDAMRFLARQGAGRISLRRRALPLRARRHQLREPAETHAFLKRLRGTLDAEYRGRILLAEANQWPKDVRPYFGEGDEFHMAFHFPLMPRIFMAVRSADRRPITDMFLHTPPIPESCQWCVFLRNHDELTLEMCTDPERDYMYYAYAQDPSMKLNIGIRRRLAPLLENDRRKIELLNSLLFTPSGTPIVYYGDEIGMGDNIHLKTATASALRLQWSADRNAGFSRSEPNELYSPVIADPIYGYQAVNVEAQLRTPSSLLHVMRRLIAVRKSSRVFGRGTLKFLAPANTRVLTHVRDIGRRRSSPSTTWRAPRSRWSWISGTSAARPPSSCWARRAFPPSATDPTF